MKNSCIAANICEILEEYYYQPKFTLPRAVLVYCSLKREHALLSLLPFPEQVKAQSFFFAHPLFSFLFFFFFFCCFLQNQEEFSIILHSVQHDFYSFPRGFKD